MLPLLTKVGAPSCLKCHKPDGEAEDEGSEFVLQDPDRVLGADDMPVQIGIRPQQLSLVARSAAHCALVGTVELAEISGSETYLHVRQGEAALVAQVQGVHPLPLGSRCTLHVDPAGIYGFARDGRLLFAPVS